MGYCGSVIVLNEDISPSPPTASLITFDTVVWSDTNQKGTIKLNFAESQNKDDENDYTIGLSAQYSGRDSSLVSASGTYKYIGCSQADIFS